MEGRKHQFPIISAKKGNRPSHYHFFLKRNQKPVTVGLWSERRRGPRLSLGLREKEGGPSPVYFETREQEFDHFCRDKKKKDAISTRTREALPPKLLEVKTAPRSRGGRGGGNFNTGGKGG